MYLCFPLSIGIYTLYRMYVLMFSIISFSLQGLNKDLLFRHHGDRYNNNMISMYDQQFNRKYGMGGRAWDRNRLSWLPEVSDHPMQGNVESYYMYFLQI